MQAQTVGFEFDKVFQIQSNCFVGLTGLATDIQTVAAKLEFRANLYRLREEREMKPKVLAHLISTLLYEKRFGPYFTEPIVAGLDGDKPFICGMDLIGAPLFTEDFAVAGTCTENLYGMCESLWRPNMEKEDLFETASQCLMAAVDRDATSGWGIVIHILSANGNIETKHLKARQD